MDLSVNRVPGMKYWNITVRQAPLGAIPTQKIKVIVNTNLYYFSTGFPFAKDFSTGLQKRLKNKP